MVTDSIIWEVKITDKDVAHMSEEQVKQFKHDLILAVTDVCWVHGIHN